MVVDVRHCQSALVILEGKNPVSHIEEAISKHPAYSLHHGPEVSCKGLIRNNKQIEITEDYQNGADITENHHNDHPLDEWDVALGVLPSEYESHNVPD